MLIKMMANVRGLTALDMLGANSDDQLQINGRGDLIVTQSLPPAAEVVRLGQSYVTVGPAIAPIIAVPTVAAQLALYNGEVDGGKSYVIDAVGVFLATSMGVAGNIGIIGQMNIARQVNPAGVLAIKGLAGTPYRGRGNSKTAAAVINDSAWHTIGPSLALSAVTNAMASLEVPVYGRYIIPPGGVFGISATAQTAVGTAQLYILWHEVLLALG